MVNLKKNSSKCDGQLNSAEIHTLNRNSTNFQKKSSNEGVSYVETLGKKTKTYLMFSHMTDQKLFNRHPRAP